MGVLILGPLRRGSGAGQDQLRPVTSLGLFVRRYKAVVRHCLSWTLECMVEHISALQKAQSTPRPDTTCWVHVRLSCLKSFVWYASWMRQAPSSHHRGTNVHQVNTDSGLVPMLSVGPFIKLSEHTEVLRLPRVVQERLQHGLELVAHHRKCLRQWHVTHGWMSAAERAFCDEQCSAGCLALKVPLAVLCKLGGAGSQESPE